MAMPEMEEVKDLALKYPKNILGRMAQMGQISSTLAVMAGMMRDRIVQSEMKPPTKTVAQEVLPAGLMAAQGFTDPTAAQQPVMRRAGGLTSIPVRDNMYEMAGGGIVAFQPGGEVRVPPRPLPRLPGDPSVYEWDRKYASTHKPDGTPINAPAAPPQFVKDPMTGRYESAEDYQQKQLLRGELVEAPGDRGLVSPSELANLESYRQSVEPVPPSFTAPQAQVQTQAQVLPQNAPAAAALAASASAPPPVAETPLTTEQQIQKRLELEQRILGTDPRTAAMQAALERSTKVSDADRILDSLRIISAGAELEKEGTTKQLEQALSSRERAKQRRLDAELKKAEVEGRDYERKARVLSDVLGEEREKAKTKEDRAFQREQLEKQLLSKENLSKEEIRARKEIARITADSRPEQFLVKALEILEKGTEAQKAAVREVMSLQGKGDLLSRIGGGGPDIKGAIAAKYDIEPTR